MSEDYQTLHFLLTGLVIGFSIAAPVGPVGILCIHRTLARGRLSGLASGFGAATAHALYGAITAFGLAFISSFVLRQGAPLQWLGGAFLLYLGFRIFVSRPTQSALSQESNSLLRDYASTFLLTITNPATILAFAAVFASFGLGSSADGYISATFLVFGVLVGSVVWWSLLAEGVGLLRPRFHSSSLRLINRISGLTIIALAILALSTAL